MTPSQLMQALSDAGAPFEAILIAVQALEAKDAEIAERDAAVAAKRAKDAERKRAARVHGHSADIPETVQATPALSPSPNEKISNPHPHTPGNKPRARKAEHRIPADWQPVLTPAAQRIVDGWPPGMFDRQVAKFLDHAADKGRTSKDWQAAFRTWIGNADDWKPKHDRQSPRPDELQNPYVRVAARRAAERAAAGAG